MKKLFQLVSVICLILSFLGCKNSNNNDKNPEDKVSITENKKATKTEQKTDPVIAESISRGKEVYMQNCAVCHQKNGGGVPNLNPPLKDADYPVGDKKPLITLLLQGSSDKPIEVNGQTYSNVMPSFKSLDDDQIADVLTYVRNSFDNKASAVKASEVEEIRSNMD